MMARRDKEPARRNVPLVRIFLSSPGDVADERTSARQLIDAELMKLRSLRGKLALELIAWDDPAAQIPMLATETPQESVNAARPRPATCDIVIVILWSRMGTPLPDNLRKPNGEPYLSGTEWEYEELCWSSRDRKSSPQPAKRPTPGARHCALSIEPLSMPLTLPASVANASSRATGTGEGRGILPCLIRTADLVRRFPLEAPLTIFANRRDGL